MLRIFIFSILMTLTLPITSHAQNSAKEDAILSWAKNAVVETFSFGHNFYQRQLKYSSHYFTPEGWKSFSGGLAKSRVIDAIEMGEQDVVSELGDFYTPSVTHLKEKNQWQVKLPIHTSFKSYRKNITQKYIVSVNIAETDKTRDGKTNLGITQWVAVPYSN